MTAFDYSGRNANGQAVTGTLDASSVELAAQQLMSGGIHPTKIEKKGGVVSEDALSFSFGPKIKPDELIILTRQLYSLAKAGVPLNQSIRGLALTLKNKHMVSQEEFKGAEDALKWAARTYLVAALGSLATLVYWGLQIFGRD